jgi:hypothetical protein
MLLQKIVRLTDTVGLTSLLDNILISALKSTRLSMAARPMEVNQTQNLLSQ